MRIEHPAAAHGGQEERQRERRAQHGGAQVARRRGHRRARTQGHLLEGPAVLAQGDLGLGAAVDVVEDGAGEAPLGEAPEVRDVDDARRSHPARRAPRRPSRSTRDERLHVHPLPAGPRLGPSSTLASRAQYTSRAVGSKATSAALDARPASACFVRHVTAPDRSVAAIRESRRGTTPAPGMRPKGDNDERLPEPARSGHRRHRCRLRHGASHCPRGQPGRRAAGAVGLRRGSPEGHCGRARPARSATCAPT